MNEKSILAQNFQSNLTVQLIFLSSFFPLPCFSMRVPCNGFHNLVHLNGLGQMPVHSGLRVTWKAGKIHPHSSFARQERSLDVFTGFTRKPSIPTANALSRFSETAFAVKAMIGVFARMRFGSFRIRIVAS